MTSEQFTQWLKGFLEAIEGKPTEKQMAVIKKKLEEVKASPVTIPGAGPPPRGFSNAFLGGTAARQIPLTQSFA